MQTTVQSGLFQLSLWFVSILVDNRFIGLWEKCWRSDLFLGCGYLECGTVHCECELVKYFRLVRGGVKQCMIYTDVFRNRI